MAYKYEGQVNLINFYKTPSIPAHWLRIGLHYMNDPM